MPVGLTLGAAFRPEMAFAHQNATFSENYRNLYLNQVGQITDDWAMKMEEIWTGPDEFNFTYADQTVAFAHANGLKVRGHTLVWELLVPAWMKKGQFADAQIDKLVQTYVHNVVRHFKDKFPGTVVCWDVINEPVDNDGKSLRKEFWFQHLGENYLEKVLRWTHEADPDALLFINEYGIEEPGPKQDYLFELARTLKRKGVPLHGIGFQCHFSIHEEFQRENLEQALDRFIGAGLNVQVTELDVRINDDKKGITPEKLKTQARIFREVAEVLPCALSAMFLADHVGAHRRGKLHTERQVAETEN
ncbi:MAG: endo-1,4-beta-xylanase [Bdellovibrionaceae bacterium]|nr:endo-1,4-beta-xylanase [Pseudobdellovibrionaceae bacterium]